MINVQGIVDNISIYHLINRNLYIQFKKKIKIEKKADCLSLMRKIIINKKAVEVSFFYWYDRTARYNEVNFYYYLYLITTI